MQLVLPKSIIFTVVDKLRLSSGKYFKMSAVSFTVGRKNCSTAGVDVSKMCAAHQAIDKHVKDGMILGIGSGSTIVYGVQRLAQRMKDENLSVVCVPTSYQARQLIIDYKLTLGNLDTHPKIDCTIDGADEIEKGTLTCLKGGGGCLTQEKIVASCSEKLIIVADGAKEVNHLGQKWKKGIPIEVIPMSCKPIQQKIEGKYGGEAILRMSADKAGPLVTDNGNFLLDWVFPETKYCWSSVHNYLKLIPGVVETGLFIDMTDECLVGDSQGNVRLLKKTEQTLELLDSRRDPLTSYYNEKKTWVSDRKQMWPLDLRPNHPSDESKLWSSAVEEEATVVLAGTNETGSYMEELVIELTPK